MFRPRSLVDFVRESNRIEGIHRDPTTEELEATAAFVDLRKMTISDIKKLVGVYAPGHRLRNKAGLNVRVGNYVAPPGGQKIEKRLGDLLGAVNMGTMDPWTAHAAYERLHPFTDGNGRSGRALWLWMHRGEAPIGFLHRFYYETLAHDLGRPGHGG